MNQYCNATTMTTMVVIIMSHCHGDWLTGELH